MPTRLAISSHLEHDGDGIVRYRIEAENRDFRGAAWAWGNETDAADLAALLRGFPSGVNSKIEYGFGSSGTGVVNLLFESVNPQGHCRVWVATKSEYAAEGSREHNSAFVSVDFLPAALDDFCRDLAKFKPRRLNEAILSRDAS